MWDPSLLYTSFFILEFGKASTKKDETQQDAFSLTTPIPIDWFFLLPLHSFDLLVSHTIPFPELILPSRISLLLTKVSKLAVWYDKEEGQDSFPDWLSEL